VAAVDVVGSRPVRRQAMRAQTGDEVTVRGRHQGDEDRHAPVLEVAGQAVRHGVRRLVFAISAARRSPHWIRDMFRRSEKSERKAPSTQPATNVIP
jgi:Domain of unknown function (DUF1918)